VAPCNFNGYGGAWELDGRLREHHQRAVGQNWNAPLPPRWGYKLAFHSPLTGGGTLNVTVDYVRDNFSGNLVRVNRPH